MLPRSFEISSVAKSLLLFSLPIFATLVRLITRYSAYDSPRTTFTYKIVRIQRKNGDLPLRVDCRQIDVYINVYDTGGRGRTGTPEEHDFESCASANSATPACMLEAATGIEPVVKVLQTSALPLGYAANVFGAKDGIRTRDPNLGKVVFYH